MNTRAKLVCSEVKENTSTDGSVKHGEQVSFFAQYNTGDSPEDNSFSISTPSANYSMFVCNPALYGKYEVGKAYYFDITPCEA